jgi:mono/diheme cytochrome c family protein
MRLPSTPTGKIPASTSLGETVYTKNCAVCHGDKGNTAYWAKSGLNPPPRDFTAPAAQSTLTRQRMLDSVTQGRAGTGMMPFAGHFSNEKISAVVTYIRYKFMGVDPAHDTGNAPLALLQPVSTADDEPPTTSRAMMGIPSVDAPLSAARSQLLQEDANLKAETTIVDAAVSVAVVHTVDMSVPVPRGLKGDVRWEQKLYLKNCFVCHGVSGQGDSPRAFFIFHGRETLPATMHVWS